MQLSGPVNGCWLVGLSVCQPRRHLAAFLRLSPGAADALVAPTRPTTSARTVARPSLADLRCGATAYKAPFRAWTDISPSALPGPRAMTRSRETCRDVGYMQRPGPRHELPVGVEGRIVSQRHDGRAAWRQPPRVRTQVRARCRACLRATIRGRSRRLRLWATRSSTGLPPRRWRAHRHAGIRAAGQRRPGRGRQAEPEREVARGVRGRRPWLPHSPCRIEDAGCDPEACTGGEHASSRAGGRCGNDQGGHHPATDLGPRRRMARRYTTCERDGEQDESTDGNRDGNPIACWQPLARNGAPRAARAGRSPRRRRLDEREWPASHRAVT